jgi:hypothetical protein
LIHSKKFSLWISIVILNGIIKYLSSLTSTKASWEFRINDFKWWKLNRSESRISNMHANMTWIFQIWFNRTENSNTYYKQIISNRMYFPINIFVFKLFLGNYLKGPMEVMLLLANKLVKCLLFPGRKWNLNTWSNI